MYEFVVSPFGVSLLSVLALLGISLVALSTREMRAGRKQQQLRQRQRQQFWGYE
jgi:heme exporter protein D